MDAFITRRGGGGSPRNLIYTINGAPNETILISDHNGEVVQELELDLHGAGLVDLKAYIGIVLSFTGSISGYMKQAVIEARSEGVVNVYPDGALYWHGRFFTDITGEWVAQGKAWASSDTVVGGITATIHENSFTLAETVSAGSAMYYATKKISLHGYDRIVVVTTGGAGNWSQFAVWNSFGTYLFSNTVATQALTSAEMTHTPIDASSFSEGSYYLGFIMHHSTTRIIVNAIYLE